jgi:hypothetical protein
LYYIFINFINKYLGIDDYKELPVVLEKMEEQITSIEMFISKLTNELDILEEKKRLLDERILKLTVKKIKLITYLIKIY